MGGVEQPVTTIDPSTIILENLVGDLEIPCDYSVRSWCPDLHADWIARLTPCSCGVAGVRLLCGPCKDLVMQTPDGFECRSCGEVTIPARHAFYSFDALS